MSAQQVFEPSRDEPFVSARLERVFHHCFSQDFKTDLRGGASEPLYQPALEAGRHHVIYYRHDYFASALHEVAHWCIAGEARRQQLDFGYWYAPDGRSVEQQRAFELVEYKPQALEWFFSLACGYRFTVSVDNLDVEQGEMPDTSAFRLRVFDQITLWQERGLPARAARFYQALCHEFGTATPARQLRLSLAELG